MLDLVPLKYLRSASEKERTEKMFVMSFGKIKEIHTYKNDIHKIGYKL